MSVNGKTVAVTDDTFTQAVEDHKGVALVDFWAAWCGPCRMIAPHVERLAEEYGDKGLMVAKLDVDSNPRMTSRFNVRSIPQVLIFKDGQLVETVIGAVPFEHLEHKVRQHL